MLRIAADGRWYSTHTELIWESATATEHSRSQASHPTGVTVRASALPRDVTVHSSLDYYRPSNTSNTTSTGTNTRANTSTRSVRLVRTLRQQGSLRFMQKITGASSESTCEHRAMGYPSDSNPYFQEHSRPTHRPTPRITRAWWPATRLQCYRACRLLAMLQSMHRFMSCG